jgi:hypothetical protein
MMCYMIYLKSTVEYLKCKNIGTVKQAQINSDENITRDSVKKEKVEMRHKGKGTGLWSNIHLQVCSADFIHLHILAIFPFCCFEFFLLLVAFPFHVRFQVQITREVDGKEGFLFLRIISVFHLLEYEPDLILSCTGVLKCIVNQGHYSPLVRLY